MTQKALSKGLKAVIIGMIICVLLISCWVLPAWGLDIVSSMPEFQRNYVPWLIFLILFAIPVLTVLVIGYLVAVEIGKDNSFSRINARYLKIAVILAASDTAFFFLGNLVLAFMNMSHPGVLFMSLFICFVGVASTVVLAVLSHLVWKAAMLREENEEII